MRLLFVGDVVGESGCDFLYKNIYKIKKENSIDITVVNGENSAQGNGITPRSMDSLFSMGVDVITTGNHCFKRKESMDIYEHNESVIRPANFPAGAPGKGITVIDKVPYKIAVINLIGTMYLDSFDNPFNVIDDILKGIDTPNIIVDFHAEATSEKKAMGFYLQNKVTAVLGTHTHVQTSDECILGGHTAYITDVGMAGPENSVLGIDKDIIINKFKNKMPVRFIESTEKCFINAVVVDFNEKTGKANDIKRLVVR
ncbi:TIGR00282 family metallophosphoesterase [Ruminococcus sp. FC2018]|uniref:TIGR00282 family metallophosphoesterase n=1 Tax=Ruminococcus sp. FC2018 TaxID=1410617 RepID=UPI00048D0DEC|nr:TIGR00282 family metallophosphoesterase [Ruminococcus sp. FC2018]